MAETILHVNIPADCAVGTVINVQYEGKYYEVVVPEGAPGNQIQVTVPYVEPTHYPPSSEGRSGGGADYSSSSSSSSANISEDGKPAVVSNGHPKPNAEAIAIGAGAAVVGIGALCLAPVFVTGVAIVGGVAAATRMAITKKETGKSENEQIDEAIVGMNNMAVKVAGKFKSFDEEHKVTEKTKAAVVTVNTKIAEIDNKYKVTEKTNAAIDSTKAKAQELDQKYDITGKANSALNSASSALGSVFSSFKGGSSSSSSSTTSNQANSSGTGKIA